LCNAGDGALSAQGWSLITRRNVVEEQFFWQQQQQLAAHRRAGAGTNFRLLPAAMQAFEPMRPGTLNLQVAFQSDRQLGLKGFFFFISPQHAYRPCR